MSEYMFGAGRGRVQDDVREQIDEIAERHGATFCNPCMPGEGYRYWFTAPNRGSPFEHLVADRVWIDLEDAGLADRDGLRASVFVAD